ncbi:MAG: leucyl aminopeptidase [Gammaproteobacteria bacterium]|nr:leucyl aminopeptidase [Gammaproteobacteria bacterium]
MKFTASCAELSGLKADSLILPTGSTLKNSAESIDQLANNAISSVLASGEFSGKSGQVLVLNFPQLAIKRIILLGTEGLSNQRQVKKAVTATCAALNKTKSKTALWVGGDIGENIEAEASTVAQSINTSLYNYKKQDTDETPDLESLTFWTADNSTKAIEAGFNYGAAVGDGMNTARQLGNLPANICTPSYLADQAISLGDKTLKQATITTDILDRADMQKLKMDSLLSVAEGSDEPPKLIVINYRGAESDKKPVVLVGKAVTFDSGGISLKPGRGMDEMKYDMCGGASVLGVMNSLTQLQLPINVVGIIPATENMPNGRATKPGDVVTSMSGQTIEILNTDAEGRLILCDSLTYAAKFNPDTVIDIATLTGAVISALGKVASGVLSNDQQLANDLIESGTQSADPVWQLPLWEEYDELLKSNFADMANIGGPQAGTITAGCFLARYAKDYKWAHLDVAGTAWVSGGNKGATGRPVPLLMEYLRQKSESTSD